MTYKSSSKIKSYAHNSRYKIALSLCKEASNVFDYGTGSGYFPRLLSNANPNLEIVGYEPVHNMHLKAAKETSKYKNIKIINHINFSKKFTFITCLEVMEHLTTENQIKVIQECQKLLAKKGRIIISVPIETGISGFLKNIFRYLIRQSHAKNLKEIFLSLLGIKIKRTIVNNYIYSHVGFRYKDLEKLLAIQNLKIETRKFSPLSFLGPILNSQVFYVLTPN